MENNGSIRDNIADLLSRIPYGLTIEEVAQILGINRTTASKYLYAMQAEGAVIVRSVGKAKLHYLRGQYSAEAVP